MSYSQNKGSASLEEVEAKVPTKKAVVVEGENPTANKSKNPNPHKAVEKPVEKPVVAKGKEQVKAGQYGKFNSLPELIKGYAMLEAGFTKKCQECNELAKVNSLLHEEKQHIQAKLDNIMLDENFVENNVICDESVKNRIIFDYLKSCFRQEDSVKPLGTGVGISGVTPIQKPRTLSEAGQIVEKLLGR